MLERTLKSTILELSGAFPALLLTGPRQVGKSVLLSMIKEAGRRYISLDNLDDRALAKTDPALFFQKYTPPLIIDEVQYAPELFTAIKIWIDEHKADYLINQERKANPAGAFWLTGSQKFSLMKGIQESLAGRIAIIDMLGLSHKEVKKRPSASRPFWPSMDMMHREGGEKIAAPEVFRMIWRGSFPEPLVNRKIRRDDFFSSYMQTYIQRDVRDFSGISNELKFRTFVQAAAVRTGSLLNYQDLARDCGIDLRTAKSWMNTLERSGLVYLLPPYSPNITKRIIKTPKVYWNARV